METTRLDQPKESPKESNIQVIVRVRPRNLKEIRENSQPIISVSGKEVTVMLGSENNNASKLYSFDKVYGPESTQDVIYEEVVDPILKEVLLGYNCTVFAYGQTGTGKTYTMNGDMQDGLGRDAGIIPRTLYKLFEALEQSAEFSYLELYNEELKDLLATDDSSRKLKIFEDLHRKGSVVVQNLEEVQVKNAADVIQTLQRGSLKRQTASTKMNDASSRSHCIFSITVHIKETTPDGEELLKVGKLNLVDLAGSECVGKSGAESKQAKEAGMINQSLLTLGRVINSLVERSPHVPFRESKLTRLLQDSLGGKTKTCIIAAVSPAKSNMDESLSTLEYAHRSKSIRNRPEVNQRMTKRTLIKEYVTEIERLKQDLVATREKNGVFMSTDSYNLLVEQNSGRKVQIEEIQRVIAMKEEQLICLETRFKANTALLDCATKDLSTAVCKLKQSKEELCASLEDLKQVRILLMNQQAITRAHADTETKLDAVAHNLIVSLTASINDTNTLNDKIERKESIELQNKRSFVSMQEIVASNIQQIEAGLAEMKQSNKSWSNSLVLQLSTADTLSSEFCESGKTICRSNLQALSDCAKLIFECSTSIQHHINAEHANDTTTVQRTQGEYHSLFCESSANIQRDMVQLIESTNTFESSVISSIRATEADIASTFNLSSSISQIQHTYLNNLVYSVSENTNEEIAYLRVQNAELTTLLSTERSKSKALQEKFKRSFSEMMGQLEEETDKSYDRIDAASTKTFTGFVEKLSVYTADIKNDSTSNAQMCARDKIEVQDSQAAVFAGFTGLDMAGLKSIISETASASRRSLEESGRIIEKMSQKNLIDWQTATDKRQVDAIMSSAIEYSEAYSRLSNESLQSTTDHHDRQLTVTSEITQAVLQENQSYSINHTAHTVTAIDSSAVVSESIQGFELASDPTTDSTPLTQIDIPEQWTLTASHEEIISAARLARDATANESTSDSDKPSSSRLPRMRADIAIQGSSDLAPAAI